MAEEESREQTSGDLRDVIPPEKFRALMDGRKLSKQEVVNLVDGLSEDDALKVIVALNTLDLLPAYLNPVPRGQAEGPDSETARRLRVSAAAKAAIYLLRGFDDLRLLIRFLQQIDDTAS